MCQKDFKQEEKKRKGKNIFEKKKPRKTHYQISGA